MKVVPHTRNLNFLKLKPLFDSSIHNEDMFLQLHVNQLNVDHSGVFTLERV